MTKRGALTDALLQIVAERGLDEVSVRQVATAGGVSIGTVQHYFPTKDDMLAAAFAEVVDRVRTRIAAVSLGPDIRHNLSVVLRELLPVDETRLAEARIQIAFAARAATSPALTKTQHSVLAEIHDGLTEAFDLAWQGSATRARCRSAAHAALALADGLALHAVSAGEWLSARRQVAALELVLDSLVADPG